MMHFIIGGARSGKSRFAQQQVHMQEATLANTPVHYVATATVLDKEMRARIQRHQHDRPQHWQLTEAPLQLSHALKTLPSHHIVLLDCLTLWLNNQLFHLPEQDFTGLFDELVLTLKARQGITIIVANEVGLGVIPMGEVSRQFVDLAGWLNQAVAAAADKVTFIAAGLPMTLKDTHPLAATRGKNRTTEPPQA
jgi:adenosylcobinamide kinase/adenosylcobinamide-phosphate guanylyltransferase